MFGHVEHRVTCPTLAMKPQPKRSTYKPINERIRSKRTRQMSEYYIGHSLVRSAHVIICNSMHGACCLRAPNGNDHGRC
eukprot:2901752-Amphidinium_carterae.1